MKCQTESNVISDLLSNIYPFLDHETVKHLSSVNKQLKSELRKKIAAVKPYPNMYFFLTANKMITKRDGVPIYLLNNLQEMHEIRIWLRDNLREKSEKIRDSWPLARKDYRFNFQQNYVWEINKLIHGIKSKQYCYKSLLSEIDLFYSYNRDTQEHEWYLRYYKGGGNNIDTVIKKVAAEFPEFLIFLQNENAGENLFKHGGAKANRQRKQLRKDVEDELWELLKPPAGSPHEHMEAAHRSSPLQAELDKVVLRSSWKQYQRGLGVNSKDKTAFIYSKRHIKHYREGCGLFLGKDGTEMDEKIARLGKLNRLGRNMMYSNEADELREKTEGHNYSYIENGRKYEVIGFHNTIANLAWLVGNAHRSRDFHVLSDTNEDKTLIKPDETRFSWFFFEFVLLLANEKYWKLERHPTNQDELLFKRTGVEAKPDVAELWQNYRSFFHDKLEGYSKPATEVVVKLRDEVESRLTC